VRALFVTAALAVALAWVSTAQAMTLAPKAGDSVTQRALLGYLFVAPQPGDWLRYRVAVNGNVLLVKSIGFGVEHLDDKDDAFFEIQTHTSALISSPVESRSVAGGTLVWKMYVDAPNFDDGARLYTFVAGVIKIGDAFFRLGSGPGQPLSPAYHQPLQSLLLFGTLVLPDDRSGVVVQSQPQDVTVGDQSLHTVHTIVDFPARDAGTATGLPEARVETWQTTDVPLGLVAIRSTTGGATYSVDLTAFGRGGYRSLIDRPFESIPFFPG
jgi:hypothetical protein